jgi:O-antigen/teichoic acid export membrane protein
VAAFAEVALYIVVCFRLLPGLALVPRFHGQFAKQVWPFAGSMSALTIQALLLTQSDRFLISRLLPISALGYYALAYNASYTLVSMQATVSSVMFPAFTANYVRGERDVLALNCAKAAQFITFCVAFPGFFVVFFGYEILELWIDPETAQASYLLLGILAFGFLLNTPLTVLSTLAIATNHVRTLLLVNIGALCGYIPCLYFLTMRFSLLGTALAHFLLQVYFLLIFPRLALQIIDESSVIGWLGRNVLPFLLAGAAMVGLAKVAVKYGGGDIIVTALACGLSGVLYLAVASLALHGELRGIGQRYLAQAYLSFRRLLGLPTRTELR